jgi:hypothetical protein
LSTYRDGWHEDPAGQTPADAASTHGASEAAGGYQPQPSQQAPSYQPPAYQPQPNQQPPAYQGGTPYPQGATYQQGPGAYQQAPTYQQAPPYRQTPYPGNYQGPPYAPYGPHGPYGQIARIPSYLGWAIAVLILCFWPTGIVAVVYASQVDNKLVTGDIPGAQYSSRRAKLWCWITFGIGVAWVVIAFAIFLLLLSVAGRADGAIY